MPEFYLDIYPVGHDRVFLAGRVPGVEEFSIELTPTQQKMLEAFQLTQRDALDKFLLGLVT